MYLSTTAQKPPETLKEFASWTEAEANGFRTRSQWRQLGRGCKGKAAAVIQYRGHPRRLYHQNQTTTLTAKTKALDALLDRFCGRNDLLVWKPHRTCTRFRDHDWVTTWAANMPDHWRPRNFIRQGWNLERCHQEGIVVQKTPHFTAQAFSIRAPLADQHQLARTNFLVLDLDCHSTNAKVVAAHLKLVSALVPGLPRLLNDLCGGTVFYQYRCPQPSGLQVWIVLRNRLQRHLLHTQTRGFLMRLEKDHPGLNANLAKHGLATLDAIEILPTETQQITIPGCYGKAVFTSRELKPVKGWFDAVSLESHLANFEPAGPILDRYPALIREFIGSDEPKLVNPKKSTNLSEFDPLEPHLSLNIGLPEVDEDGFWSKLKTLAQNGVPKPDQLYGYIRPLAQALYFRDFANATNKSALTEAALLEWVMNKGNGNISRSAVALKNTIKHLVQNLEKTTNQRINDYYQSMLVNDLRYPHRIELISDFMASIASQGLPSYVVYCKCADSDPEIVQIELPQIIIDSVHQGAEQLRKGKVRERFIDWAKTFINHLYNDGQCTRYVGWKKINQMMVNGKEGTQRHTQDRYKALLVKAGILEPGWQRFIRRGSAPAKYTLTGWAADALRSQRQENAMTEKALSEMHEKSPKS